MKSPKKFYIFRAKVSEKTKDYLILNSTEAIIEYMNSHYDARKEITVPFLYFFLGMEARCKSLFYSLNF